MRETAEEVGLELGAEDECIGRLSDLNARPQQGCPGDGGQLPLCSAWRREVKFVPNYEVAETVWVPLEFLLDTG